jgi:hypothetical protein
MLKSICLAGVLLATAAPALAQSCGSAPIAPAIPGASDLSGKTTDDAHKYVLDVLKSVKGYQQNLGTYRTCLKAQEDMQLAALNDAKTSGDKTKIAAAKDQAQSTIDLENKTIDSEQQVATDFNRLHEAYCKMGTGLAGCAAPK